MCVLARTLGPLALKPLSPFPLSLIVIENPCRHSLIEHLVCSSLVAHECTTFYLFELVNSRLFCGVFKFSKTV